MSTLITTTVQGVNTVKRDASTTAMNINSDGVVTKPNNPAFVVTLSSSQLNTAVASWVTVSFGTRVHDPNSDFDLSNMRYVAPVSGVYIFTANIRLQNVDTAAVYYQSKIEVSNPSHNYYFELISVDRFSADLSYYTPNGAVIAYVNAGAYVTLKLYQGAGTAQTDIGLDTTFSGALIG